jgi:hypothetical protein
MQNLHSDSDGANKMRVEITKPPGIFADGMLKGIISEQDTSAPNIVIEMIVTGVPEPVMVTLDDQDLSTIVRLAKGSKVKRIRDAIS